jgi:ceroid-lipofuscinosis MFS transporter 7
MQCVYVFRSRFSLALLTFCAVVGRRPQGELLGWFASSGSLARMFFPIMAGYIVNYKNVETLFGIEVVVILISIGFLFWVRNTLTILSS